MSIRHEAVGNGPNLAEYSIASREKAIKLSLQSESQSRAARASGQIFNQCLEEFLSYPVPEWSKTRPVRFQDWQLRPVSIFFDPANAVGEANRLTLHIEGLDSYFQLTRQSSERINIDTGTSEPVEMHDVALLKPTVEAFIKHPEGLTDEQEKLLDVIYTTPVEAKATVGRRDSEDRLIREEVTTDRAIAASDVGFVFVHHDEHPDAPLAPIKVNLRELPPKMLKQIGVVFSEMAENLNLRPNICTGIPNAGVPLARAFEQETGVSYVDIFDKLETEEGRDIVRKDDGDDYSGQSLLIIDDVVTQAETKRKAYRVAETLGFRDIALFVIFDREEGGSDGLRSEGRNLHAAMTLDQGLRYGVRKGYLTRELYDTNEQYIKASREFLNSRT